MERGWKSSAQFSPNCPRCGSSNTKFCYYNNYSLTQPRYFCKGCRRYWTKGGSLRNVPVGGGCRKNRRAKSLRLSTDGLGSRNSSYVSSSNQAIGNSYGPSNGNSIANSTSVGQEGSHIDLALVYANFLNQQPESKSNGDTEISEMPCNSFDHMRQEFTSLANTNIQDSSRMQLLEENAQAAGFLGISDHFAGTHLSDSSDSILYFNGFESMNKGQERVQHPTTVGGETSYTLPPLPGEDLASQQTVWSSQLMVSHNPVQPTNELPVLSPDAQDTNLLLGNWNPFDLSSDDTFSGNY